ncbi:protein SDA1 homolog [Octopus sinensis]|uniref:Protein SDA1 n=1 Tax=Octopus sinensis TaxID=2607531 RepID=A0A6P7SZZ6_9MOLL|nr:protein SDA1 homolog [Octopus sinensis]
MSSRHHNQLPNNLPQLQNLIKRDPQSYCDEFLQQHQHFISTLEIFQLKPSQYSKSLDEMIMFLAQVAHCYAEHLTDFPQQLKELLLRHSTVLDPTIRMSLCRALILLRNKSLISGVDLLQLFFQLFICSDKLLRKTLYSYVVSDIYNVNAKHKNGKLNRTLQNFMYDMLKDSNAIAAKKSLDVMIELYRRNTWKDAKTVNVISTACFSKVTKIMVAALKFFLSIDPTHDSESESEEENVMSKKSTADLLLGNRVSKKTKKRRKRLNRALDVLKKHKKKKRPACVNFSTLHLLHDPQEFADRLFKQLQSSSEYYDVKILMMDLISRLIGVHQLFLLNFYPFIQKYLQPRQKDVTKILLFAAQASHDLVPPDVIENIVKTIAYNFITERNSADAIAVGLNAVKEIISRCPLALTEELIQDLAQYKSSREKAVSMASRGLIQVVKQINPNILNKKDRGRLTEAMQEAELASYGDTQAKSYLPGAEVLLEELDSSKVTEDGKTDAEGTAETATADEGKKQTENSDDDEEEEEAVDDEDSDNDGWESCSSEEIEDESGEWVDVNEAAKEEDSTKSEVPKDTKTKQKKVKVSKAKVLVKQELEEKKQSALQISDTRIFTEIDFEKINHALVKKQLDPVQKRKRKRADEALEKELAPRKEILELSLIEMIHKKRKHDKEARLATVQAGKTEREQFGKARPKRNPNASSTNKEKKRNKNFMMVKHKLLGKKNKRSFREKQVALRDALLKKQRTMRK